MQDLAPFTNKKSKSSDRDVKVCTIYLIQG